MQITTSPVLEFAELERKAQEVRKAITATEEAILRKDPSGRAWTLRVLSAQRLFRILNEPRFRLEPVDLQSVLNGLQEFVDFIEETPSHPSDVDETNATVATSGERRMQTLYGLAWSQLSDAEYADAADLLRRRLLASNLSPSFLKDARCLDVGTGIGRFALAMVHLGARETVAFDFSEESLAEARRRLGRLAEFDKIALQCADIYNLPNSWEESFDFVCANGVIHHMVDPEKALAICQRLVKRGGFFFVFVFAGNESPWQHMIETMRHIMAPVPIEYAEAVLRHSAARGTVIFNVLDYSYTPIQFKLPVSWYENVFARLGFSEVHRLQGGAIHDSEMRARLFLSDRALYDVSEVRYLLRK